MRNLFEAQLPSPDVSNEALPSDQSKYDQEIGSNAASRSGDTLTEHAACWCCPYAMDVDLLRKVLAEALGTFILMYSICAIIAITQLMGGEVGLLEYAATAALSVVVIVFSIGAISGAHVNPSVTIAFATFGQFPWSKVPLYILAQLVGSVLATYVGKLVYGIKSELMTTRPLQGSTSAFWVELIATLLIMFLASSLAHQSKYVGHLSGFVVGTAIGLAVLITGPVSGGSLNPARSLGPAIVSWKFDDVWIYLTAPTIGAVGGAFLFHAMRLQRHPCCSNSSPSTALVRRTLR
ncbi:probable aquaporin NIP7-1 isoform X1 [Actinidia eriantha]|uniref:probable aquaporin NIP7-1 isoform X1 n=1 Tax=Actinidia eriantha TaxID=165200 RepID=UPI002583DF6E|nr:probable aquaporin NIP7-1 isoform X1 [Actinidia eriantha]